MKPVPKAHARQCRKLAAKLIPPLRAICREHGYALAVHGSLRRDIDLVAIPWVESAVPPPELAKLIMRECKRVVGRANMAYGMHIPAEIMEAGCPGRKPHGLLNWNIVIKPGAPLCQYIDLNIMPTRPAGPVV